MTSNTSAPEADGGAPAPQKPATTPAAPVWVPIRSLPASQRDQVAAHLTGLSPGDRYLRFGYPASDAQIARYVTGLDFERDEVFGVFNRRLELIALAHLAYPQNHTPGHPAAEPAHPAAEFGGSVVEHARGRGYGTRLFEHAMLHARNRGLSCLFIHALSENTAMLRIARKAGATVERAGSESDAYLRLPHETVASQVEQWVGDGAAEIDYRIKRQAQKTDAHAQAVVQTTAETARPTDPADPG